MLKNLVAVLITGCFLSSCDMLQDGECDAMGFEWLAEQQISAIKIHDSRHDSLEEEPLAVIEDAGQIADITDFIIDKNEHWYAPWAGVPVGQLRVVFWSEDDRIHSFSVGEEFVVAQGCGYFFIHEISKAEQADLLSILGIDFEFE